MDYMHLCHCSTRPFLSVMEKKWIVFQLLKVLEECQSKKVSFKLAILLECCLLHILYMGQLYWTDSEIMFSIDYRIDLISCLIWLID